MLFFKAIKSLATIILFSASISGLANAGEWDGKYSAKLNFNMKKGGYYSGVSKCASLPLEIKLQISNGNVTGKIINNLMHGTGLCKSYHNGSILWKVQSDGLVKLTVKQSNVAASISSNSITGKLNKKLWLYSKKQNVFPATPFKLTRTSTSSKSTNIKQTVKSQTDYIRIQFNTYSIMTRKSIQKILKENGYYSSTIDGEYGKSTRSAIEDFSIENGYSASSMVAAINTLTKIRSLETVSNNVNLAIDTTVNIKVEPKVKINDESIANNSNDLTNIKKFNLSRFENTNSPDEAQRFMNDIQASVVMYLAIREVIDDQPKTLKDRVLNVIDKEIKALQSQKVLLQNVLSKKFSTPIKPNNSNLIVSAFRASDTFPKIPYYIPGTNEIGESLVTPKVSDDGYLNYEFDFIDPIATYDKVRDTVIIPHENIDQLISAMGQIYKWTEIAQQNSVNRRVSKTATCIPVRSCEVKEAGNSSTEVIFQIYEDGSTSGRIQLNKGKFNVGYNMSVESTILLQAYLIYMRDVGSKEFSIGVMSDDDVLKLFD